MLPRTIARVSFTTLLALSGAFSAAGVMAQVPGDVPLQPHLTAERHEMSAKTGGWQRFRLQAGPEFGGSRYMILGSTSGSAPGIRVGGIHIPLKFDFYTAFTLLRPNAGLIQNQLGRLDGEGNAQAGFWLPAELPREVVDMLITHCYLVFDDSGNIVRVSNPVSLKLVY